MSLNGINNRSSELTPCFVFEQLEALKGQQSDITKQLDALKSGSVPEKEELDQIQILDNEVAQGEALLADLNKKSSKLRDKVQYASFFCEGQAYDPVLT